MSGSYREQVRRLFRAFSSSDERQLNAVVDTARMQAGEQSTGQLAERLHEPLPRFRRRELGDTLTGGGTDGNERLTTIVGAVLLVVLAVLGITIIQIRQLIWLHLFLGLLLLGPVVLKMASTGYRFIRYYTRNDAYRTKGPPEAILRWTAPALVASTVVVFVSGILLLVAGPGGRDQYLALHKVSFIVWLGMFGVHVLGHLPAMAGLLPTGEGRPEHEIAGSAGRWLALAGALVAGLVLAIVLIPQFAPWLSHSAFPHHHHHG